MSISRKGAVVRAIEACARYILGCQAADGSWRDWNLPPGESLPWTTAFVGYRLIRTPAKLAALCEAATHHAAKWLLGAEFSGGGWGYNERVGTDADSTACAILFLASQGSSIAGRSYRRLKSFQLPDGGFSTYLAGNGAGSWGIAHPDVSAAALLALLARYPPESATIARGIEHVLARRTPAGLWNSFWCPSPLFATEASLSLLDKVGVMSDTASACESIRALTPRNAFECALMVSIIGFLHRDFPSAPLRALIKRLLEEQKADGSWESEPILRVTRRDCFEPWKENEAGSLYHDPHRLFTSATVLEAMSRALALMV